MKSLLIISLSLLLSSRAFTRDIMNPFSEAKLTNSWKYAIAGFTYCKLSIFMFRYLFAIPFANLNKKFYIGCYIYSQNWTVIKLNIIILTWQDSPLVLWHQTSLFLGIPETLESCYRRIAWLWGNVADSPVRKCERSIRPQNLWATWSIFDVY